jgi:hypothetical protein
MAFGSPLKDGGGNVETMASVERSREPRPESEAHPPFPFLVSSGRSGTTLLRAMMNAHPQMAVPPETFFVTRFLPERGRWETPEGFATERFVSDVLVNERFGRWELPETLVREAVTEERPRDYGDAIRSLYALYARTGGKRRYADKTPVYIYEMPALAETFPEARFVHVIRDGRDVAPALVGMDVRPNGLPEAALLWRERVEAGRAAGRGLGPHRYMELRYEDLVSGPEEALRDLCEFISLDYDPAMLTYPDTASEVVARDGGPERHRGLFLEPTTGFRDWRTDLTGDEVEVIELLAGETLAELGYELAADTGWAAEHPPVQALARDLDRLRRETLDTEAMLRGRARKRQEELEKARRRNRRLRRRLRRAEVSSPLPEPGTAEAAPSERRRSMRLRAAARDAMSRLRS